MLGKAGFSAGLSVPLLNDFGHHGVEERARAEGFQAAKLGFTRQFDAVRVVRLRIDVGAEARRRGGGARHAQLRQHVPAHELDEVAERVVEIGRGGSVPGLGRSLLDADVDAATSLRPDRFDALERSPCRAAPARTATTVPGRGSVL